MKIKFRCGLEVEADVEEREGFGKMVTINGTNSVIFYQSDGKLIHPDAQTPLETAFDIVLSRGE